MVGEEVLVGPRGGGNKRDYNDNNDSHIDDNNDDEFDGESDESLFSNDNLEGELDDNFMVDEEE